MAGSLSQAGAQAVSQPPMPGSVPLPVMWNNVAELSEFQLKLGQSEGPKPRLDVLPMAGVFRVEGLVRSETVQKSGYVPSTVRFQTEELVTCRCKRLSDWSRRKRAAFSVPRKSPSWRRPLTGF
jgi:hypothetical protein